MTQRSERRKAELAVLSCASAYVDTPYHAVNYHLYRDSLTRAVHTLRALGLDPPTQTRTSKMAGVNSNLAAAYMHGAKVKTQTGWILRRLFACYPGHGYTTDELVIASAKPHQSISARVNELRDSGWIVDSGTARKTRSNQDAAVWALTPEARETLRAERVSE